MRLEDIVSMNKKLVPKPSIIITVCIAMLPIICMEFVYAAGAWIGILAALMMAVIFLTAIPMNHIFNKSVFGEYAYQYMSIPVSFMELVKGKVLAAFIYCSISVFIFVIGFSFFMINTFNSGGVVYSDFIRMSTIAFINMHEVFSDNMLSTGSVIFVIGTAYIGVLIEALFISAGTFYAIIIRNIIEPQREKITIAIGVAAAAVIVYIAFSILCVWLPGLFFKNDLAIAQLIIAAALKIGAAYGLMVYSAKLLEKKYSLN